MKKKILLIIIITILQTFSSFAQTQVYNVGLSDVVNAQNCGSTIRYRSANTDMGFRWTSVGAATPTSVTVQLNYAVNCSNVADNSTVRLNNVNQPLQPTPGPYYCSCTPGGSALTTWTLNLADYNVGGLNTVLFSPGTSTQGLDVIPGNPGIYAIVTVNYATPGPEINIKGSNVSILNGDASPIASDNTEFGNLSGGTALDHTFTIQNQGSTNALTLTGTPIVNISGSSAFTVQTQPASNTIAGLGSQTFSVRFNPTCAQTGLQTAVVSIASDDADENPYTFTVQGTVGADNVKPVAIAQNLTVQLDTSGSVTVNATQINNGSTDNCGISSYALGSGSVGTACDMVNEGSNLTLTAAPSSVFTKVDFASYGTPSGSCGNYALGGCNSSTSISKVSSLLIGQNSVSILADNNNFGDPCNGTPKRLAIQATYGPVPGSEASSITYSCANVGTHDVVLFVTDNNGNVSTVNATITVEDIEIPVIASNGDQNVNVDANTCGATVTVSASATDNCTLGTLTVIGVRSDAKSLSDVYPVGTTTITWDVTDANGNAAVAVIQTVTVTDNEIPVIASNGDQTVTVDANTCGATVTVSASATDNCTVGTPNGVRSDAKLLSDVYPVGTTTIKWNVSDANGNAAIAVVQTVKVTDNILPTVIAKNILVQLDAAGNATIQASDVNNNSFDDCGITALTVSPNTFTCANVGNNTVTLTATDANGNVASKTVIVTIENKNAPIALAKNTLVQLNATGNATITAADVNNGSTATCGTPVLTVSPSTFTCANVGANTVTLTVTDANGNVSLATAIVTVQDKVAPVVLIKNATVQLDASGNASITASQIDNGSSDTCGIASITVTPNTFSCNNVGVNQVTLKVTDVNGNVATATATVTVGDLILPTAKTRNLSVQLDDAGNASVTVNEINNGSSDNCGIASVSVSKLSFDCTNVGANTVILTVTDKNGNKSTATAIVTVTNTFGDNDNDGILDNCDADDDNDGISDAIDNCPITANPYQEDRNHNGLGDACDKDQMNISEAFTPNGDGINDTWVISNIENHPSSVVRVFNRWGAEVFVARNYQNDWDGHSKGNSSTLPAASSYYYQIDLDGNGTIDKQGWIYINR